MSGQNSYRRASELRAAMAAAGRPWIPPGGLVAGQLAQGLSWPLLFALAWRGEIAPSAAGVAWVHLVALAWVTVVALSILVYLLPKHGGTRWRWEGLARAAIAPLAAGAFALVAGMMEGSSGLVAWGATLAAAALTLYLCAALPTLAGAPRGDEESRSRARSLTVALVFLAGAAALGTAMAWGLAGHGFVPPPAAWPALHAHLAGLGWLSALTIFVSLRTLRPIAGGAPPAWVGHVVVPALLGGTLVLSIGTALWLPLLQWLGAAACVSALGLYLGALARAVTRRGALRRAPAAFGAASGIWLIVAAILGLGVLAGRGWAAAYAYAALIGWLGQMVNGHLAYFGVRLIATRARGGADAARPDGLLSVPLSWAWFCFAQLAVACGVAGALAGASLAVEIAAICGAVAWLAMAANGVGAWRRAQVVA